METSHLVEAWETHYLEGLSQYDIQKWSQIILTRLAVLAYNSVQEPCLSVDLFKNTKQKTVNLQTQLISLWLIWANF